MTGTVSPVTLFLADDAQTARLGADLSLALKAGDCVALSGEIGAGKSTLARAFLRAMADDSSLDVPSPTFTLVQQYDLRIPVAHFDLYRLGNPDELHELGFEEMLGDGICLVEWPEMASGNLPQQRIELHLDHEADGRRVTILASGQQRQRILRSLTIRAFLADAGLAEAHRSHLSGDASSRAYETIIANDAPDRILMDWPKPPDGPPVQDGKPYAEIAHIAREPRSFVAIAGYLRENGFIAPDINRVDFANGIVLMNDLGREGVVDTSGQPIAERYIAAAECLARLHAMSAPVCLPVVGDDIYQIPPFDPAAMKIEVSLLPDWYVPERNGSPLEKHRRDAYFAIWDNLIDQMSSCETHLVLRDFHSPNILWQNHSSGIERVGLIDFQDAMIGPSAYDLASLVQDARVDIPSALAQAMMDRYLELRRPEAGFGESEFLKSWSIMAAQRNCKLAGIWVRLNRRDGKPGYMKHMPRTMRNLFAALEHPALAELRGWLLDNGITPGRF